MTSEFGNVLDILRKSVFGKEIKNTHIENADAICSIANSQGVLPLVYSVLSQEKMIDQNNAFEKTFLAQIYNNERKMFFLQEVIEIFSKNNIDYCVLKGCTIAELYCYSECRISSDVDILINESDEEKATVLLAEQLKMQIVPRAKEGHHFLAKHPQGGLFEIHIKLYSSTFDNVVLENKFQKKEPASKLRINNEFDILTLGLNDNLFFLTAHLIKHFIKEGCGIRQITDLLIYVDKYKAALDFENYFSILKSLNFDEFIKNIFGIGVKFFDLDLPVYADKFIEVILNDVENGGSFGFSEKERLGFFDNFIERRVSTNTYKFRFLMTLKRTSKIIKGVFFPNKNFLINKGYVYLNKTILLYPIAYLNRIVDSVKLLFKKQRHIKDFTFNPQENDCISNRMDMMKDLGIISGGNLK